MKNVYRGRGVEAKRCKAEEDDVEKAENREDRVRGVVPFKDFSPQDDFGQRQRTNRVSPRMTSSSLTVRVIFFSETVY